MKIGMYYSCPFESGGVEKTMYNRAKKLAQAGHEITFIYSSLSAQASMLEKWAEIGNVRYFDLVKDEVFDLVIYDAIYNLKQVKAKHNNYIQVINGCLQNSKERYETKVPFKKYVSVSTEAQRQFKAEYGRESIVIPNIINEEEIVELSKQKVDIKKKKHNFLMVSRIDRQKGFDRIEPILIECQKRYGDDYQLVIVGSCNLYPQYVNEIKERLKNYNVIWEGQQDNPYKYMAWADSLWQLSNYESQCMVMYESLVIGTPCVCTDFPNAIKELTNGKGFILKKDLSNLDLEKIESLKKDFKYHYPDYGDEWLKIIEPPKKVDYKFSVIIPNYNNGEYLERCLNSVLSQTYKNFEIIFVDDKSEDNSLSIANKLLKPPHKVIEAPYKKYNGGTRNLGIIEASGDYIMCIDSDDWLINNKVLEELNDFIDGEDVIRTGYCLYAGNEMNMFTDIPNHNEMYDLFIEDTCAVWTKVIKTEILKNNLFSEGTLMEDKVHHYRIIDDCNDFADFQKPTHVWNRTNAHSVSTKRNYKWDNSMYRHIADMLDFVNETNNDKYRRFVLDKINMAKTMLKNGEYKQI